MRGLAVGGLVHRVERLAGRGVEPPGELVQDIIEGAVVPAALVAGFGEDLIQGRPEPQASVADRQQGRLDHASVAQRAQHLGPGFPALPVALLDGP